MAIDIDQVMAFEISGNRIAIWKTEDKEFIVSNTFTKKSLLCLSLEQALDIFDACLVSMFPGNKLLN